MQDTQIPVALFRLGKIIKTLNAQELIPSQDIQKAIRRHQAGDWGEISEGEKAANDQALEVGRQIVSVYRPASGPQFLLITEGDRSVTTVLLPEDR